MSAHKDRIYQAVTGSPGTGAATLGTAFDGFRTMSAAYGANATVPGVLFVEGNTWEIAKNCAYDHSAGTISRGTFVASSTGSAVSFGSSTVVSSVPIADWATNLDNRVLGHSTHDGTADVTGVVGTLHVFTALTADRTFTLPSSASAGDRVGVSFPAGSASYEVLVKSASGDKINNVDCSSTEWSRLFVAGEVVIFRCIDSSTVDWVVEQDGRIPTSCRIYRSADVETTTTSVTVVPLDTNDSNLDVGGMADTANNAIKVRRAGRYNAAPITGFSAITLVKYAYHGIAVNSTSTNTRTCSLFNPGGTTACYMNGNEFLKLAVDDLLRVLYQTNDSASKNLIGGNDASTCALTVTEVL